MNAAAQWTAMARRSAALAGSVLSAPPLDWAGRWSRPLLPDGPGAFEHMLARSLEQAAGAAAESTQASAAGLARVLGAAADAGSLSGAPLPVAAVAADATGGTGVPGPIARRTSVWGLGAAGGQDSAEPVARRPAAGVPGLAVAPAGTPPRPALADGSAAAPGRSAGPAWQVPPAVSVTGSGPQPRAAAAAPPIPDMSDGADPSGAGRPPADRADSSGLQASMSAVSAQILDWPGMPRPTLPPSGRPFEPVGASSLATPEDADGPPGPAQRRAALPPRRQNLPSLDVPTDARDSDSDSDSAAAAGSQLVSGLPALRGLLQQAVDHSRDRHALAPAPPWTDAPPSLLPAALDVASARDPSALLAPLAHPGATSDAAALPGWDALAEEMLVDRLVDRLNERLRDDALRHLGFTGGLV